MLTSWQCSLGFFVFIDASSYSHNSYGGDAHVTFVDWIPGICSALGMLVINSIEKSRLSADSYSSPSTGVAWRARLVLFLGFALMAGGLAGSVVGHSPPHRQKIVRADHVSQAVMVLKYLVPGYSFPAPLYFGVANVVANGLIMLRLVAPFLQNV